jgi:Domain of Unknown Function (DUF1206)
MTDSMVDDRPGSEALSRLVHRHPSLVTLARLGWVAKGLVYGLVGALAVPIAINGLRRDPDSGAAPGSEAGTGSGESEASQVGAVGEIADASLGAAVLWLVAAGLVLYGLWRLVTVVLPADNSVRSWLTRAGYLVSVVVYSSLAWTAVSFARRPSSSGSADQTEDAKVEQFIREVLEWTAGRWIVGALGIAVIGVGAYWVHTGVTASFRDEIEPRPVGPVSHAAIVRLGRAGWIGRGVMMAMVGFFVTRAAVRFDSDEAQGIDGALREATTSTIGASLVAIVALGLILYGTFCIISAPRQRLTGAD